MDFDFRYPDGTRPVYIWSLRGDKHWCSVGAPSDFIPPDANEFIGTVKAYTTLRSARGLLNGLDQETFAAVYSPTTHWLGFSPTSKVTEEGDDPSMIAFSVNPAPLQEHYYDVQRSGGSDDGDSPVFSGYFIEEGWQNHLLYVSRRLYDITMNLVLKDEYYGPNSWTTQLGDLPEQLQSEDISGLRYDEREAQEMADDGRRVVLSQMGFLSWYISVRPGWKDNLEQEDVDCITELRLEARSKRGYIFDLSRDYHEINIPHMLNHRIPFHWCWTNAEAGNGRFIRYGPEFWSEYTILSIEYPDGPVDLKKLPQYLEWEADLGRYDMWFQDRFAGLMGGTTREFRPEWQYAIVDFSHYGARTVDGRLARRAYAERFKSMVRRTVNGSICTFFRQNPFRIDDPPAARIVVDNHYHSLHRFGNKDDERGLSEIDFFLEETPIVRELSKNRNAPRPERTFNTYNGMREWPAAGEGEAVNRSLTSSRTSRQSRDRRPGAHGSETRGEPLSLQERMRGADLRRARSPMSPTHQSENGESSWGSRWAQAMAERRRSSRSFSPVRRGRGELRSSSRHSHTLSSERSSTSAEDRSHRSFSEEYQDVVEGEIPLDNQDDYLEPPSGVPFDHPPGPVETYQARFQSQEEAVQAIQEWSTLITELRAPIVWNTDIWWNRTWLEKAILVCEDARTRVRMKTWAACCGLTDLCDVLNMALCYGAPFALYVKLANVRKVGMPTHISSLIRSTLESLYDVGFQESFLQFGTGGASCYGCYLAQILALLSRPHAIAFIAAGGILSFIAQIYDKELVYRFLEGHVVTGNPATDTFLWPHPSWLEKESDHFHGAWTAGAYQFMRNLQRRIVVEKDYVWRTRKDWTRFIRTGNRGAFAAARIPTTADFEEGLTLIESAFPEKWEKRLLIDIAIPEKFDPTVPRD
ncbi:hypothetical protein B0H13DRAFT_1901449 [Mycena leptocephala]|nr:hypothetical protein B0H13DRAFT_1901449 [Mycena leptocephala]